jgi:hypothetical protein
VSSDEQKAASKSIKIPFHDSQTVLMFIGIWIAEPLSKLEAGELELQTFLSRFIPVKVVGW